MLWQEFLIDRLLTQNEIIHGISKIFSISSENILLINDIAEVKVSQEVHILCEQMPVKGDFCLKLSIYLYRTDLENRANRAIIQRFCDIMHCKCLLSDDSVNPFSMLLLQEGINKKIVFLDVESLEREEYIIAKYLPNKENCL